MSDFCIILGGQSPPDNRRVHAAADCLSVNREQCERFGGFPGVVLVRQEGEPVTELHVDDDHLVVVNGQPRWKRGTTGSASIEDQFAAAFSAEYARIGAAAADNLEGVFSIVVVSRQRGDAFACIDRMGVRPLAYARNGDLAALGTSALACARAVYAQPSLRDQSLFEYVYFHVIPSPHTIFDGVLKLPPAHALTERDGRFVASRYWTPVFRGRDGGAESTGYNDLLPCIEDAVRVSTPEGRRVGCYLSGGLDSSTMAGVLARQSRHGPIDAYTVGFAQEGYDEMEFARAAAERFGLRLHEEYISIEDIVELAQSVTSAFDEPFGNSSAIPSLFCASAARRDGIDVMVAGDGGDELFGGNERYAKQKVFDAYQRVPRVLRTAFLNPVFGPEGPLSGLPVLSKAASYIQQATMPMPDRTQSYNFVQRTGAERMFTPDFLGRVSTTSPCEQLRAEYSMAEGASLVDRMLFLDWKFILADNDLRKVGRTAHAAGVDVKYPLLDAGVVEFSLGLAARDKVRGLTLRHFYKTALTDFLPHKIINKTKHGFGLPFGEWLRTSDPLRELVNPAVDNLVRRGILLPEFVSDLHRRHEHEHASFYGNILWVLFMLENWLDRHNVAPA